MQNVHSRVIRQVGYDRGKKRLQLEFNTGKNYLYKHVPADKWRELMGAPSLGHYFRESIREKYPFEKVALKDRLPRAPRKKSMTETLQDLRKLDTPEKWRAYIGAHHDRNVVRHHHEED